ncbi:MAG: hypothetical protein IT270_19475 [Saprospiraceae bacterium]|nr:hypothetical protein [Saprospiraceae bacterium]
MAFCILHIQTIVTHFAMKQLIFLLCLSMFIHTLQAQITVDTPEWSFFHGATFSLYYDGQFYAVQHKTAPSLNLSANFRIVQSSLQKLVVYDNLSDQTHTYLFEQPTNANEYRCEGIVVFSGAPYTQMLLRTGADGRLNELDAAYLGALDSGAGLQSLGCFCAPDTEDPAPCDSGGEGATDCRVNFDPYGHTKGCITSCSRGYHACCNLY